jgi:nucleotide-binding universal stress UspA family protein
MKILVAIEQSTYSSKALEQAIEMAKEKGAELTALTIAETIHGIEEVYTGEDIKQKLMEQATATLEKAKQAAQAKGIALNTLIVGSDTPAESIIDAAHKGRQQSHHHGQPG